MEHFCVRCHERPIWGVFARVHEYTRSVIVAAHGLATAAHGMYHDSPDNPETARDICRLAADKLGEWLYNRLPASKGQYEILAHARDTFRNLASDGILAHENLVKLELALAEYLAEEGEKRR
jgi:hypothetical protein